MENVYCRFCAEPKSADKLINLNKDRTKCNEIVLKLTFLNAMYVDFLSQNSLPKTVCLICYESLNKAYEFLDHVKKSQDILSEIFLANDDSKFEHSDDDFMATQSETEPLATIKTEDLTPKDHKTNNSDITIKLEPKEELPDISAVQNSEASDLYQQTLNVQDLIGAALNRPFSPSVQVLADYGNEFNTHKITSWKDYTWLCAYCHTGFLDIELLRAHTKTAHGKCSAFCCTDCKETTKKDDFHWFVRHVRKHRKNLKRYCHYCDKKIDLQSDTETLKSHIKQHLKEQHFECRACGEFLPNEELLQQHLSMYATAKVKRKPRRKPGTPITVEDLTCHICKNVYKNPNSLRDHIKRHKSDRKRNYTCDRCGKTFFNKGTLTSHIMTHDQIRPHICRICNKSFLYPNMLRRHVEMHTGVKPYSCEVCGRCFRLQYQLNAHKIIHTDSMPYICQYCSKAFRFKQILKNHERQHTGAKPYSCEACGMEFSNWSNYNKHMKRRHNLDTSKKKITPSGVFPINPLTGQIIQIDTQGMEEWKSKIMIPVKRGKKKIIKKETDA